MITEEYLTQAGYEKFTSPTEYYKDGYLSSWTKDFSTELGIRDFLSLRLTMWSHFGTVRLGANITVRHRETLVECYSLFTRPDISEIEEWAKSLWAKLEKEGEE